MIRTRWLVALTIATVGVIGALVYGDETARSDAALDDLGEEQAVLARTASLALAGTGPHALVDLQRPGSVVIVIPRAGTPRTLDGRPVGSPELEAAIARGESILRVAPEVAPSLGLSERTAMVGIARAADGTGVAVATSAERQRDRDRAGRLRVLLSMLFTAGVMSTFAWFVWRKQRTEAELERDAELGRLSRAATMAAVGSGVAHEVATPLAVIVGRAEQLMARVHGDERAVKHAQAILDQAEHINQVVRGLLGLARGAPIALQAVDARALVRDAAALVEHRFARAHVHLVPAVGAALPAVRCEPLLFKHALVNLMLNACDASPVRGTVRVDVHADAAEMAFVVTDEGDGITPQNAARALEPFFTPHAAGQGLGLAIANEIAKTHRGSLAIGPTAPRGTRACIRIPIEIAAVVAEKAGASAA